MSVRILTGDCRKILADMEPGSVQCCITSPPYFGLRDYNLEPLVWGGKADCEHDWGAFGPPHHPGQVEQTKWKNAEAAGAGQTALSGQTCQRCSAWRGQLGLEPTPDLYLAHIVECFGAVKRVLRDDGTLWLNIGDCYAAQLGQRKPTDAAGPKQRSNTASTTTPSRHVEGLKPKDLVMMPARVALALQADGWWLRSDIIWSKPNPMPESVTDRPTSAHEHIFLLTKSAQYFYDAEAVRENWTSGRDDMRHKGVRTGLAYLQDGLADNSKKPRKTDKQRGHSRRHAGFNDRWDAMTKAEQQSVGRNLRNVWEIATAPFPKAHFATFPPKLVEPCIKAGTSEKGCCPECGSQWVREVESQRNGQDWNRNNRDGGNRLAVGRSASDSMPSDYVQPKTIGWSPSCACKPVLAGGSPNFSCTILDLFAGSGTVGLVADRLGRDAILIDQSQDYCDMARSRIKTDAGIFARVV